MWAHYADSHKGLALGFDVPIYYLQKINYIKERINVSKAVFLDPKRNPKALEKLVTDLTSTKHHEWIYEKEARLVVPLEKCVKEKNLYFKPFNKLAILKEVILGANYKSMNFSKLQLGMRGHENVEFVSARAEFTSFKMTEETNEGLWKKL